MKTEAQSLYSPISGPVTITVKKSCLRAHHYHKHNPHLSKRWPLISIMPSPIHIYLTVILSNSQYNKKAKLLFKCIPSLIFIFLSHWFSKNLNARTNSYPAYTNSPTLIIRDIALINTKKYTFLFFIFYLHISRAFLATPHRIMDDRMENSVNGRQIRYNLR